MVRLNAAKRIERQRAFRLDENARYSGVPDSYHRQASLTDRRLHDLKDDPHKLYFRSPVKIRSALCASLFMTAITRLDMTMDNLRTADLTDYLNAEFPQIIWEPYSVGKMLGELYNVTWQFLHEDRLTWPEHLDFPILRDRRPSGLRYSLGLSLEAIAWFHAIRIELRDEAYKEMNDPKYSAGSGTWAGRGQGETALFLAASRVRNQLVSLNLDIRGLFSIHPDTWVTNYNETRSI